MSNNPTSRLPAFQSTNSGIRKTAAGDAYIPASRRADGSTRKEIRVRPGYIPPEDVATYKNRTAEGFRTKGGGVPGADALEGDAGGMWDMTGAESAGLKSKNAKRRENARKNKDPDSTPGKAESKQPREEDEEGLNSRLSTLGMSSTTSTTTAAAAATTSSPSRSKPLANATTPSSSIQPSTNGTIKPNPSPNAPLQPTDPTTSDEKQRKIRATVKKLRAVQDLKARKAAGEKLSPDQLVKLGKEAELVRDLKKLGYEGEGEEQADGKRQGT